MILRQDLGGRAGIEDTGLAIDRGEVNAILRGHRGGIDVLNAGETGAGIDLLARFDIEAGHNSLIMTKVVDEALVEEERGDVRGVAALDPGDLFGSGDIACGSR